jgi:hypothetical protein
MDSEGRPSPPEVTRWRTLAWALPGSFAIPLAALLVLLSMDREAFVLLIVVAGAELVVLMAMGVVAAILAHRRRYGGALILSAAIFALEVAPLLPFRAFNPLIELVRALGAAANDRNLGLIDAIPGVMAGLLVLTGLPLLRRTSRLTAVVVIVLILLPVLGFVTGGATLR